MNKLNNFVRLKATLAVIATGLSLSTQNVTAHHAFSAEFDALKPVEVKGVVTKAEWVNPHSWVYVDVKEADGTVSNWGFEFGAPFSLKQKGLTKTVLPSGTEVIINGYLSKNGKKFAYSTSIKLADGRVFQTGGAQDAPALPSAGTAN